ncbi:MAG: heat-inducible transcriptional repressor HrcA [Acidimicrobiales bacterium]
MDERKAAILRSVVEEYIETAQPVGSGRVARSSGLAVSPATVRNEMTALEQEGYLHQPHTSAGRIPTDKGYRFFVDGMVGPATLASGQRQLVQRFFASAHGALEEMLQDTSRLLSSLTDYAAVVVGPPHEETGIRSVQLVGLAPRTALIVAVLANGTVEKATVDLADDLGDDLIGAVSVHLSASLVGRTLSDLPSPPSTGDGVLDDVCTAAVAALGKAHDGEPEQVYVGGAANVAAAFDAVDSVRRVLATLEQQYVVVTLLKDVVDRGLSVAIGTEHGLEPLSECSLIVAPYEVEGEQAGTVGVLGPTRMHYPEALAAVALVSRRLGKRLSEG